MRSQLNPPRGVVRALVLCAFSVLAALLVIGVPVLFDGHNPVTGPPPARNGGGSSGVEPTGVTGSAPAHSPRRAAATGAQADGAPVDPALFQTGSCQLYPPTDGNRHLTVFLDAGHGGVDPGAVGQTETGQTVYEADLTLPVELDSAAMLRAEGFRVAVSRTRDSLVGRLGPQDFSGGLLTAQGVNDDIAARDECADLAKADVLVGIYFDAGDIPENAGCLTAYDHARSFWPASLRLAQFVQTDVLSALNAHGWGVPNDGVLQDLGLGGPPLDESAAVDGHLLLLGPEEPGWFDTPSTMPGALIEPLFITDPFEASIAASAPGQEAIASGINLAIEQYFGEAGTPTASPGTTIPPQ